MSGNILVSLLEDQGRLFADARALVFRIFHINLAITMPTPVFVFNADSLNIGAIRFDHLPRRHRIERFFRSDNIAEVTGCSTGSYRR